jgi:hypothetical protein
MPPNRADETPDESVDDVSASRPVDMDDLLELRRKVMQGLRDLVPDWQSAGLIDDDWLRAYEASLEDPMIPPPPPPMLGRGKRGDIA